MSEPENKQDQLERMLDKWGQQLPEAPAQLVTDTLNKIQISHSPRRNWFSLGILGGMVAASLVVAVGLVVLVGNNNTANPPATQVAAVFVATPTTENGEVANPVNTAGTGRVAPVATSVPEVGPTPTAVPASTATAEAAQPTIESSGPTPATLETTEASVQPPIASANTQAQTEATPIRTIPAVATPVRATVAPVEPSTPPPAGQTKKPSGPIAIIAPEDGSPTPAPPTLASGAIKLTGRIVTLEGSDLILSTDPERIYFNAATIVTLNGQTTTIASLKVSQNATIIATRNAQGQLVASSIAITPSGPKKG